MIKPAFPAVARSLSTSLAGLLAGLLLLPLPGSASGSGPAGRDPGAPGPVDAAWRLAQGGPVPNPALAQLQELIQKANALQAKGAYAEAALLSQQILAIVEKVHGPVHPDTATSLNNLAELYRAQGRYGEAEPLYKRSLAIYEKALGPEHPSTATSLNNLAGHYRVQGRYGEAEPLYKRSLAIREKALGPEHPDTAISVNNLAMLYQDQGRYGEAEPLYKRTIAIFEKALGPEHPDTATSLNNLAGLYYSQGRYGEAEPLYKRSLAIREKALGPEHPDTAISVNNLAMLYQAQGRYGEAEPLYKRTIAIFEKALGPEHPDTATSLNNLALLYRAQGRYGEAEPLYKRSLAIREKALGQVHPDTAISVNSLAMLYQAQGRYGEAEPLYKRSLAIREKALGQVHPDTASSLNNLALLYRAQGRYGEAEPLYKRTIAIFEKALGPEHPDTATSLNNLAELYRAQGRYGEAEPLYKRTIAIVEKALGPEHPSTATSLNNLAGLYYSQGRYGEAEPLYKRTIAIVEKALGPEHPSTATSLNNLTVLHLAQTNAPAAEPLLQRLNRAQADWLRRELPLQPRDLRGGLLDQQPNAPAITFALLDLSPAAAPLALETRLNRQGLLAEIERRQALLKASSPETRQLAEQLAALDRQLASLTLPPSQREPLRQRRQQLETQLYRLFPALKIEGVSTAQVAAALTNAAPQGLLVEFQKYRPYGEGANGLAEWGAERYVALLLRPDGTIRSIPLGEAAPIDAAVSQALIASAAANQQAEAPQRLAVVSRLVLTPLQKELAGVTELFLSPDGELNRLPFAALPLAVADGPTLGESVRLRLLTTGRELVRLIQPAKAGAAPVLVANPDFNAAGGPTRSAGMGGAEPWQPLEGTQREADQLAPLLRLRPEAVISGPHATANLVLRQKAPRILHIATHGFFHEPPALSGAGAVITNRAASAPPPGGTDGLPLSDDPLQRSGLVFAGANRPTANPADDGYLTAAEATAMDLEGTELVTLSACETGRGGVRGGEGVYGLQRALVVAGARSTLLSLWKVDDAATAKFMAHYYALLEAGVGRADALRQTQAFFRDNKSSSYHDIRVWGAFQLSGDWRPMSGW